MHFISLTRVLVTALAGSCSVTLAAAVPATYIARRDGEVGIAAVNPIRLVYAFNDSTNLENIAVRSNGKLLLTTLSHPWVYTLNPSSSNPQPTVIATFNSPVANSVLGIAEYAPDQFAVITELSNTATFSGTNTTIWTMDLRYNPARVRRMGNGMTAVPGLSGVVGVADSTQGAVWGVEIATGRTAIILQDPALGPIPGGFPLGINGLHVFGSYLYFTNSGQGFVGRVTNNGWSAGPIEVLATKPSTQVAYDDFAIDSMGRLWIAGHTNALDVVYPNGTQIVATTSLVSSPTDRGPSACAFGRGSSAQQKTLYVTTSGGGLFAIDTDHVV
ncbi:hypothetical protein BKA62DRAFT_701174 [Auriculariales sp. MPI-PUGE-AT-0066]|nr:hypothetical protein BKA62DRAFT_701174 [Auriculariales sp. MPI-PUGE-AT-0066]